MPVGATRIVLGVTSVLCPIRSWSLVVAVCTALAIRHPRQRPAMRRIAAQLIVKVFQSHSTDEEFLVENDTIITSRIEEDWFLSEEVSRLLPQTIKEIDMVALGQAARPRKLCIRNPGMLDSLCFEVDDKPSTHLKEGEIEIDVKASALK